MWRMTVLTAIAISVLSANCVHAGQSHTQDKYQKINTCKAKIGPKGLKGDAYKSAMKECTINPDNYN